MTKNMLTVICLSILLSIITVAGDIFIKNASLGKGFSGWKLLLLGAFLYGITALGWFFVFRGIKVSSVAVLYSVSTAILLVIAGIVYYRESVSYGEMVGIILGVCSIILLVK